MKILNNWWGLADMGMPNPTTEGIRVIIVSHSGKQWETLKLIMEENGLLVVPPLFDQPTNKRLDKNCADVLLINLDDSEDDSLDALIDSAKLPVLFNDSATIRKPVNISGRAWGRRLCEKLTGLALEYEEPDTELHLQSEDPGLHVVEASAQAADAGSARGNSASTIEDERGFYVAPAMDLEIDLKMLDGFELEVDDPEPEPKPGRDAVVQVSDPTYAAEAEGHLSEFDTELELDLEMDLELAFGPAEATETKRELESEQQPEPAEPEVVVGELSNYQALPVSAEADTDAKVSGALAEDSSEIEIVDLGLTGEIYVEDSQIEKLSNAADRFEDSGIANLAREVWVLGASIGGPQAVKSFLRSLPANFPAGFILAQHIGVGFVSLLAEQLRQVTDLEVLTAEPGKRLLCGQLVVAPVEKRLVFDEYGYIQFAPITQRTIYSPSIDDVITEVARKYGKNSRAIIFSGM
ncbi:MAG TPA: chemotaxis protein CheB, partial [Gammaproteobacteria bacterium]|nr:chemotaxis protein CheB [Gammaproteobacteria bacterium]